MKSQHNVYELFDFMTSLTRDVINRNYSALNVQYMFFTFVLLYLLNNYEKSCRVNKLAYC